MVSVFSSMIWVARRFSRAISMLKKPEVNPANNATAEVPMIPMPMVTSTSEKASWPRFAAVVSYPFLIFIVSLSLAPSLLARLLPLEAYDRAVGDALVRIDSEELANWEDGRRNGGGQLSGQTCRDPGQAGRRTCLAAATFASLPPRGTSGGRVGEG